MEVWGAEGGSSNWHNEVTLSGGKGGYSCGTKSINGNSTLYISVGKSGISNVTSDAYVSGVFNGGAGCKGTLVGSNHQIDVITGTGGGCTSIQTSKINDGQLKHYESVKNTAVLIVAGGGGGAVTHRYSEYNHRWCGTGGAGGGLAGVVGEIFNKGEIDGTHQRSLLPTAGTQTSAGVGYDGTDNIGSGGFGFGGSTTSGNAGAGGGGVVWWQCLWRWWCFLSNSWWWRFWIYWWINKRFYSSRCKLSWKSKWLCNNIMASFIVRCILKTLIICVFSSDLSITCYCANYERCLSTARFIIPASK